MSVFGSRPRYQVFLEQLKACRTQQKVPQTSLADRLDSTQSVVSKIERGERRVDPVELVEILRALDTDPAAFMTELTRRLDQSGKHAAAKPAITAVPAGKRLRRSRASQR